MSGFTRQPRLVKGAIVGFDLFNPLASVTVFQYNPSEMSRSLAVQGSADGGARSEVLRLTGPPAETIDVKVRIDAADQLEQGDPVATTQGIHPKLAALEMLVYPKSLQVALNLAMMAAGVQEIVPSEAPFTLFVWGPKRVVPVRVTTFTIHEQQFDPELNPIRADVTLGLRVLSYNDFPPSHPGFAVFLSHQVVKEALAVVGSVGSLGSLGTTLPTA